MKSTSSINSVATAANNAAQAAKNASESALASSQNAAIAAKAAADSATAIAVVATDTSWMKDTLKRVEGSLNEMNKAFVTAAQHADVVKNIDDHELRLTSLETEKTRVTLLLAVSGFLLSTLIGLVVFHMFQ